MSKKNTNDIIWDFFFFFFFFNVKQALTRDTLTVIFSLLGKSSSAIYIHVTKVELRFDYSDLKLDQSIILAIVKRKYLCPLRYVDIIMQSVVHSATQTIIMTMGCHHVMSILDMVL
jgi:hypothetical protein